MLVDVLRLQEGDLGAAITIYIPDFLTETVNTAARPAVVICPGGAYMGITEKEAEPVALRFLAAGFCAFVLRYSIGAGMAVFPSPFLDAARAVMLVRSNAGRWGIDPNRICLCGFSTGGHVAAVLASTWQEDYLREALGTDFAWFKPNTLLLGYPLLDMNSFRRNNQGKSEDMNTLLDMMFRTVYGTDQPPESLLEEWNVKQRVTFRMPPTFLWTTAEDTLVAREDHFDFIKALAVNQVPYEFHIFENGPHGLSLGDRTVGYSEEEMRRNDNAHKWAELAADWVRRQ